jgi:hypothetical protein
MPHRSVRNFLFTFAFAVLTAVLTGFTQSALAIEKDCHKTEAALEYWRPVREDPSATGTPADELAIELVSCLGSPDPELRDRIAYELFTAWLRGEMLSDETRRTLVTELRGMMIVQPEPAPGNKTFARSFSALVLSELMRSDAIKPFMNDSDRQALLDDAITSIGRENDYRGLDGTLGWVHPVAHMSDLLWRIVLHKETSEIQAETILDAIRNKVAPTSAFYTFNESDRLARVVTTLIRRKLIEPGKIAVWLGSFETPLSMEKWSDAFASPQGMAELHNTKLFLRALSDQIEGGDVDPLISKPLSALVQGFTQLI